MTKRSKSVEAKVKELDKDIQSRTVLVTLKESYIKKIDNISAEKIRLQEQAKLIESFFNKENQRESDLIEAILDKNDINISDVEQIKLSEDKTTLNIILKKTKTKQVKETKEAKEVNISGNNNNVGNNIKVGK